MKLTERLLKIASLVSQNKKVADIGTDHGYIPVYLLKENVVNYAILADINKGPLENARKEVNRNKLNDKVDLRLGSGIEVLKKGEVDEIIIAGMGGSLISELLMANEEVSHTAEKLILQPMQNPEDLRKFLYTNGYEIMDEYLVKEERRLYEIIVCKYTGVKSEATEEIFYEVGEKLIEKREPLLEEFVNNKINECNSILEKLNKIDNESVNKRKVVVQKRLNDLKNLLNK